jgi:hypothetical protein
MEERRERWCWRERYGFKGISVKRERINLLEFLFILFFIFVKTVIHIHDLKESFN